LLPAFAYAETLHTLLAIVERGRAGDRVVATATNGTKLRILLLGFDAPEIAHGTRPGQPFREDARH
jgi:endonuclease YncB( thermonuclease family)